MPDDSRDITRLKHILDSIENIQNFVNNAEFGEFQTDLKLQSACLHQLEIIGEAANHISDELTSDYPEIDWLAIIGLRNLFIHEYFGVDILIVWQIIESDLPSLKSHCRNLLKIIGNSKI